MLELSVIPIDAILSFSTKMLAFLAGLAALIFVHELGHFLVARKVGVVVEKFALGFGPKLAGFKKGETEYLIAAIPLGGYVKMKGEEIGEGGADEKGSFSAAAVEHRLAIAFAGPLFNILFAKRISRSSPPSLASPPDPNTLKIPSLSSRSETSKVPPPKS